MKKSTLFLTLCLIAGTMISCNHVDAYESSETGSISVTEESTVPADTTAIEETSATIETTTEETTVVPETVTVTTTVAEVAAEPVATVAPVVTTTAETTTVPVTTAVPVTTTAETTTAAQSTVPVEEPIPANTTVATSAPSVADEPVVAVNDITRDDIQNFLNKLNVAHGEKSFISAEKVSSLTLNDYGNSKSELSKYEKEVNAALKAYFEALPDECVMFHEPEWVDSMVPDNKQYVILDPDAVPDNGTADEIVRCLEWSFQEALYGEECESDYNDRMAALKERFGDMGTVAVCSYNRWYLFDTATDEAEILELFPDYSEIRTMLYSMSYTEFQKYVDSVTGNGAQSK